MTSDPRQSSFSGFVSEISSASESSLLQGIILPSDLRVCVIGASTGIGEHIAYAYAAAGVRDLIITARDRRDLSPIVDRLKQQSPATKTQTASVDIAVEETVAQFAKLIESRYGGLDILVLNAGYSNPNANMCDAPPAEVKKAFDINALGTYNVAYNFVPILIRQPREKPGIFLVVGSGSSAMRRGPFCNPGYSVSKLAQARMVEYLAEKYDTDTLLSINISPGTVATRMSRQLLDPAYHSYLKDDVGLCGATCVWLTSNASSMQWLSGRFIYATWRPDQLLSRKEDIIEDDLLKFAILT